MINIIKADSYRFFRSKTFFITLILVLFFIIVTAATGVAGNVGVNTNNTSLSQEELEQMISLKRLSASQMVYFAFNSTANLIYLLLVFVVALLAVDFSNGTIKNAVCYGVSRISYVSAKLLLTSILTLVLVLINLAIPVLIGFIFNGSGSKIDILEMISIFFIQLIWMLAFNAVAIFFALAFKRTSATIGCYLGFCLAPSLIIMLLINFSSSLEWLQKIDPVSCLSLAANLGNLSGFEVAWITIYPILIGLFSIIGGILIFNKAEIK